jgi:xylulokinase
MAYLMGIDIGTSSLKTVLENEKGELIGLSAQAYALCVPQAGYAEQDPETWWQAAVYTIQDVMRKTGISPEDIACIGFSGQMHGLVALDKEGKVIRNAILHCDQRSGKQVAYMNDIFLNNQFQIQMNNPVFPGFQLVSLLWVRDNEPQNFDRIYKVICPKDYIRFRLTGEIGTEITDASGTLAFDVRTGKWAENILNKCNIDKKLFPEEICYPYDIAGKISALAAKITGLSTNTSVVYGGADQPMQSLGNGVCKPGTITSTIGTSGQVLAVSDRLMLNKNYNTNIFCYAIPNTWYGLGGILCAGLALKWFTESFSTEKDFSKIVDQKVADIPPCSNGLIFFPCLVGERTPYMDPNARGIFLGAKITHQFEHFIHAIMEGVCFALKSCFDLLCGIGHTADVVIASGGATKSKLWLQMQADILGQELFTTKTVEQAATGAAIMAAIGSGMYKSAAEACNAMVHINTKPIVPIKDNVAKYAGFYNEVYQQIYSSNKEIFQKLSKY